MKYASVCSGIECASLAWGPLGWAPAFFSEIEPFPCAVLAHRYPDVPNLGDMQRYREWPDATFDVLVGGTPCQSFSVAGLRQGLADPRGNLALVFLGVVDRFRPRWVVWENVPGVLSSNAGRDFGAFLGGLGELGYGWSYRVLDAQYFGVAQRRRRVFVVGHLGDWRPAAAVLFERESLSGHPAPSREARERVAASLTAGSHPGKQFRGAALIVASPPCQEFSYMAMPWKRAKQIARALRGEDVFPDGYTGSRTVAELTALFDACFRIQREACEAAGRHIPMVVENVRGAVPWVGRARWNFGSYYLWGDVPALMPATMRAEKFNPDGTQHGAGSWFNIGSPGQKVTNQNPVHEGAKLGGKSVVVDGHKRIAEKWRSKEGQTAAELFPEIDPEAGRKGYAARLGESTVSRKTGSKSPARKMASAMIAKIPFALALHIAETYYPSRHARSA